MCGYCEPEEFDEIDAAQQEFYNSWAAEIDAELRQQEDAKRAQAHRASLTTVGQLIEALGVYNPDLPLALQQGAIYCRYDGLTTSDHPSVGGVHVVIRAGNRI